MAKSRLQIAKQDILSFFENEESKILMQRDIASILVSQRDYWRLAQRTNTNIFIEFLIKKGRLKKIVFPFPNRRETRYTWGEQPITDVLLTLGKEAYFSHYTAMQMHGMTEQIPKIIYINHEQKFHPREGVKIGQKDIDRNFKNESRKSNNLITHEKIRICMLTGQFTNLLGVITNYVIYENEKEKVNVRLTNIERTLIDIVVRPSYSGGIFEILKAYESVKELASVNSLSAMLKKIKYLYPYHQAIGYYLEKAGYPSRDLEIIRKIPMEYDFYLTNKMGETKYIKDWKLYIPVGF